MSKEARIGFLGLLLITIFLILVPSSSTRDSELLNNTYNIVMDDGSGITEKSAVKLAGVTVGIIRKINFLTPQEARKYGDDAHIVVTIDTDAGVEIPIDSKVSVNTETTGNFWLSIDPGVSQEYLKDDETVRLASGFGAHSTQLNHGAKAINALTDMTKGYRDALSDPDFRNNVQDMASNARFYTNELKIATADIKGTHRKIDAYFDKVQANMLQQLDRMEVQIDLGAERLKSLRPRLNESLSAYNMRLQTSQRSIEGMLNTAKIETERFKRLSAKTDAQTQKLVEDPQYRAKLRKIAHKLENLANTANDIHCITKESSVQEGLKNLTKQYREQSEALKEKVEKWEHRLPGDTPPKAITTVPGNVPVSDNATISDNQPSSSNAPVSSDVSISNEAGGLGTSETASTRHN